MRSSEKLVSPRHLARKAVIYVRQSTPHQVLANQESLKLQYALKKRARALGWRADDVEGYPRTGRHRPFLGGNPPFEELLGLVSATRHLRLQGIPDCRSRGRLRSDYHKRQAGLRPQKNALGDGASHHLLSDESGHREQSRARR